MRKNSLQRKLHFNKFKLLIGISICLISQASSKAAEIIVNKIAYNIENTENKTLYVTYPATGQFSKVNYAGKILIPSKIEYQNEEWSVIGIGEKAFAECHDLIDIELSDEITYISDYAFFNDYALAEVKGGNNISRIGNYAFSKCVNLKNYPFNNSNLAIGDYTFAYCENLSSFEVGAKLEKIGEGGFYGCDSLEQIDLNNYTGELGIECFSHSTGIKEIAFPKDIEKLPDGCFSYCTSLKKLEFPEALKEIGNKCFLGCSGLEDIMIPASISEIGEYAFSGCTNVCLITNNNSDLKINTGTFENLLNLTDLFITGISDIPEYAFSGCANLVTLEISTEVNTIGNYAFAGCSDLTSIYSVSKIPPVITINSFDNEIENDAQLMVPIGARPLYAQDAQWSRFKNIKETDTFPHSGVDTIKSDSLISIKSNKIQFTGRYDHSVLNIFNLKGELIGSYKEDIEFSLPEGIYILNIGGESFKILIP